MTRRNSAQGGATSEAAGDLGSMGVPTVVQHYYATQVEPARSTLLALRERIMRIIPAADEVMKYAMPTFVVGGKPVVGLMAHSKHIGLYPYSGSVLQQLPEVVHRYGGTKSALHLPVDRPVPLTVLRVVIRAKLATL